MPRLHTSKRSSLKACMGILAGAALFAVAAAETVVIEGGEYAGIAGYRALWDTPILAAPDGVRVITDAEIRDRGGVAPFAPGQRSNGEEPAALAFDAIHRFLLVRFPDAAEQLAARLNDGFVIEKAELILPFADEEVWPEGSQSAVPPDGGYLYRANWGVDGMYRAIRPTWHAVAWALRRPWKADAEIGPTYNAFINGAGYWTHFAAQDENHDRVPLKFGPTPVHYQDPTGRMDITAALTDTAFGETPGARLRRLADCGFIIRKWETYDHRYFQGAYEWGTGTGPRAIVIDPPRLEITLARAAQPATVQLPPAADVRTLAEQLREQGRGGWPTAVMPTPEELTEIAENFRFTQPDDMPDWQWQRIQDLFAAVYGPDAKDEPFWFEFVPGHIKNRLRGPDGSPDPYRVYEAYLDGILGKPYRGWHGFEAGPVLVTWFIYRDALPLPVQEMYRNYWIAWLMPDRETAPVDKQRDINWLDGSLVHPMVQDDRVGKGPPPNPLNGIFDNYWEATGDWRGNKSFYRAGFNYMMSTVNFNNTASMGALLGGAVIDSERAIADGRHGQANWALRQWTWHDGSSQEEGDDYYFGVTMRAQKMVADFGPDVIDRMLGRSMLLKSMTMLVDTYHPGLRRYITGASRTSPHYRTVTQDGLYSILHSMSHQGALTDIGVPANELPEGHPKFGHEFPPDQVARGAAYSPYAPVWYQQVIDAKPLPYEVGAAFKRWGTHDEHPIQRKTWLGRNFGLYSMSTDEAFLPAIAQWRRRPETVATSRELGTMLMRMGTNDTRFVNDAPGWINSHGSGAHLQSGPRLIAAFSPWQAGTDHRRNISSIQASLAFYNYELPEPTWTITVDGQPVTELPFTCRPGSRIVIRDGVTGIGIIPLEGTDLGGGSTVVLRQGETQEYLGRNRLTAALVIDNLILRRDEPLAADADWEAIRRAGTGFAIEFADLDDDDAFADFRERMRTARVSSTVDADEGVHDIVFASGGDTLEMGVRTTRPNTNMSMAETFTHRRVNGRNPDLAPGVERESPFSLHATTGRMEKEGVVLATTPGMHAKLQREPNTGVVLAANPLAELNDFRLTTPDGGEIAAAGKIGIAFVTLAADGARVIVDHAFLPAQLDDADAADALLLFGAPAQAAVVLNDRTLEDLATIDIGGRQARVVPLKETPVDGATLAARYQAALEHLGGNH